MSLESMKQWLGSSHRRPDGSEVTINTRYAALERGAEHQLAKDLRESTSGSSVLVVFDKRTQEFAEPVERVLRDTGFRCVPYLLQDNPDGSSPSNDDTNSLAIAKEISGQGVASAVAVGSGTINDLTKYASHLSNIPYMVYGTAASMNGYNSPISAMYVQGLKSSVSATPALGIYADPEVIAKAPRTMHLAGLGDLCSKPFAGADAAVADILAEREPWRLPTDMVHEAFDRVLQQAEAIGRDDADAIASLMEALWISGFSMALAGTSAPASGGEHLWSHRIDMARHDGGLPPMALHGTQVGIACGLVRPLFSLVHEVDATEIRSCLEGPLQDPTESETESLEEWLTIRHSDLNVLSRKALREQAEKKFNPTHRHLLREQMCLKWVEIRTELELAYSHATQVEIALERAGAPRDPMDMGLSHLDAKRILRVCRDIRNRFTILDLTAEVLGEDAILSRYPSFRTPQKTEEAG